MPLPKQLLEMMEVERKMSDTQLVQKIIEDRIASEKPVPMQWVIEHLLNGDYMRLRNKAEERGFRLKKGMDAGDKLRFGAKCMFLDAMDDLSDRFVVRKVGQTATEVVERRETNVKQHDPEPIELHKEPSNDLAVGVEHKMSGLNNTRKKAMIELRQQEVIEVFYFLDDVDCVDMWAVAYDEDGLLDEADLPTDIHYERKTIWVNNRLRRQKQKRQLEIANALKVVCEQCGHGSFTALNEQGETNETF